jgi:hypothetical protein
MDKIIVGIDPQPSLLAVHVREGFRTHQWFVINFRKKSSFNPVQKWQEYIATNCVDMINKLYKDFNDRKDKILVVIEQQRGRVNALIEHSLLMACMQLNISRLVVHPNTWKKSVKLNSGPGNKTNKQTSVQLVEKETGKSLGEGRVHDKADAYCISKCGLLLALGISNEDLTQRQR